jgi:indolepyruvate ferredoxin oxidoreductase
VAANFNRQAFLWGRRYAHQPEQVLKLLEPAPEQRAPLTLDEVIADRQRRLERYQNAAYGQLYQQQVARLRAADPHGDEEDSLTLAVAQQLYRLMAIKDEYEVARLYTDGEFRRKLESRFEGDFELRFNLAPPLLAKRDPNTGHLLKQEFGPWMMRAFSWLARLRFLRGTALDVFGYSAERHREHADLAEYRQLLDTLLAGLEESNYAAALELARLSAKLRGFGHVKDRNRELLAPARERLLREFRGEKSAEVVKLVEVA